ncbi:sulfite exporter TauE/SafE family protein [Thiorhodococcus fuscus]|uniref:Probable membrane transporter protein n=1 Tax=Thiorhodococcus fuscus TaxID=527200 RepID=A0ABW4Y7V4_9GAMM
MSFDVFFLLGAGFLGGVLNSVAGGGSFITFPALLWAGVPPISANATNTFAACAGYLSGTLAFREDLRTEKAALAGLLVMSLAGGILGAWLLMQTPEARFREAIPWLMLIATLLFAFGGRLNGVLKAVAARYRHASSLGRILQQLMLLAVCIYGGFFNAGLGIVILSYLVLVGHTNINVMNGLKLLASSAVSIIAIALFIWEGAIAWREGGLVLLGTLAGGYAAAHLSRTLPQAQVRTFVLVASVAITGYFFLETYGA